MREPGLVSELVQLVGLAVLLVQLTPPVQLQMRDEGICQPDEGEGRFAVAVKLLPQLPLHPPFVKVPPQAVAVIVPGVVVPGKVVGLVSKVTVVAYSAAASTCSFVLSV